MKIFNRIITAAALVSVAFIAYSTTDVAPAKEPQTQEKQEPKSLNLTKFRSVKPASVRKPIFPDSAAAKKFAEDALLKYGMGGDYTTIAPGTTFPVETDTAGVLRLAFPKDKKGVAEDNPDTSIYNVHRLFTSMKAERYAKCKIKVDSKLPVALFADGKELTAKGKGYSLTFQPQKLRRLEIRALTHPGDTIAPELKVEYVPDEDFADVEILVDPEMLQRFSIETNVEGLRVKRAHMSDDGNYLLIDYAQQFSAKNTVRHTELYDLRAGKILNPNFPAGYFWLPSGKYPKPTLGYTVKNGDKFDLYAVEVPSMARTLVASNLPEKSVTMSPDGSFLIYSTTEEGKKEKGDLTRYLSPDDRIPGNRDRSYLSILNLETGVAQPVVSDGPSTYLYDISPDSKRLLVGSSIETPAEYPFYNNRLIEIDVNTLRADTIISNGGASLSSASYSPDGKKLFIVDCPNAFGGVGLNAGNHPIANDYDYQGYLFDIANKTAKCVTRDFDPSISGSPEWNFADGKVYFRADKGYYCNIYSYDPKADKIAQVKTLADNTLSMTMGQRAGKIAYTGMGYTYCGGLYLTDLKTDKAITLDNPMAPYLKNIDFAQVSDWSFTASDGTVIDGTLTLPPDFDPQKKYPLIVYYYGGTLPSTRTMTSPYSPQMFASRGYVVYSLNPSGSVGYGQEFSARHVNAWGKRTAEDIIEGTKELCKTHPFINADKIGCIGASYGGFMTQYLQTQTDIFAAAVSHAGISNVTSYWGEGYWGYSYNSVAAAKSYPWTDPKLFTEQGSLFNADKIHTPLLLLHGTSDTNVPIGESIQLFNALKLLGREVEFISVSGEDHYISDYEKRKLWQNTIMAWFAKWLQDDPRWWNSMYK